MLPRAGRTRSRLPRRERAPLARCAAPERGCGSPRPSARAWGWRTSQSQALDSPPMRPPPRRRGTPWPAGAAGPGVSRRRRKLRAFEPLLAYWYQIKRAPIQREGEGVWLPWHIRTEIMDQQIPKNVHQCHWLGEQAISPVRYVVRPDCVEAFPCLLTRHRASGLSRRPTRTSKLWSPTTDRRKRSPVSSCPLATREFDTGTMAGTSER
jgi:hypothetical protein